MSVSDADVIDTIGTDRETGDIVLTVSDHLGWGEDSKEHIAALQRKLERYVDFVQSGQIHEEYPQAAGRRERTRRPSFRSYPAGAPLRFRNARTSRNR